MSNHRGNARRAAKQKKRRAKRRQGHPKRAAKAPPAGGRGTTSRVRQAPAAPTCRYDPNTGPDDERQWLARDETERIAQVEDYHRQKLPSDQQPPDVTMHATLHVLVENQLAANNPPEVRSAIAQLQRDGMSRHHAIHAISVIVAAHLRRARQENSNYDNDAYQQALRGLNKQRWLALISGADGPSPGAV
ncbi:MAG TPA: DUF1841 family protein [Sorangium sp.]|nr:DUF1841 family protein [Sorangium sp.]